MEWERAKNYILVFFVLLNIGLALLWFMEYNRYVMTAEQERIIRDILSQNNISMYTRPMRRSPPMRPLNVTGFYYDEDWLLEIFFDDPAQATTISPNVFACDKGRLEISHGWISYEAHEPYGFRDTGARVLSVDGSELTRDIAAGLTDEFMRSYFPEFRQDSIFYVVNAHGAPEGVRIVYRQMYRGQIIHSNFAEFWVTTNGIERIDMRFGRVLGHDGHSQMIFSPDEVLLTFAQRMRHTHELQVITHMDLAYFQEYICDQPGNDFFAIPFYRIFVVGDDRPFLINAYTNVIID